MDVLKPTTITVTFDSTCRMEVDVESPDSVPTVLMSAAALQERTGGVWFEVRKPVETQEQLMEAIRLLRQTDGNA
jgi:hypothetical protein